MPSHPKPSRTPTKAPTKKRPRQEKGDYLAFVRQLPCLISGREGDGIEAAHVRFASYPHGKFETGVGRKPDDRWAVPLHHDVHNAGADSQHANGERKWWTAKGIDPLAIAALLFSHYHADDLEAARQVCQNSRTISLWIR